MNHDDSVNDFPIQEVKRNESWIHGKKCTTDSLDFDETESVIWRKHQLRRFFQDRGSWWTSSRRTTAWKWVLVIITGIIIACIGTLAQLAIVGLTDVKLSYMEYLISINSWSSAFFSFYFISISFAFFAGILCWLEPNGAGSGIPEIKAYLNGVNLNNIVRIRVLFAKVVGMCFSVASGLPLGKEGPMIHTGSIVAAAASQGKTITFGFDGNWSTFQDLRNDRTKRDFVTIGAAAGVAAAFRAPIGGILFTLEEGASFWSLSLTFRSFFCAMVTMLTVSLIFAGSYGSNTTDTIGVQFGYFGPANYRPYELIIFTLMGIGGGVLGAFFNSINWRVSKNRIHKITTSLGKFMELFAITSIFTLISFVLPLCWQICTPKPIATASFTSQEYQLLNQLKSFQCPIGEYNQVASLFLNDSDSAMQLLFHYTSPDGNDYVTFSTGALLVFLIPYFLMAAWTSGCMVPAGLFVPTLLAGAAYGRIIGSILNRAFPGHIASPGTYALIGAASVLGGVARMTIAGAVIILEACGSTSYLLPLMLTFAAARYSGNAINEPIYEMLIRLKDLAFLEASLKTLGLLNYHPVAEVMARPVVVINEISRVSTVYEILKSTSHNGFPVLNKDGHLRGFILRKALCSLLKYKTLSFPVTSNSSTTTAGTQSAAEVKAGGEGAMSITSASTIFHDTIERNYPDYPTIDEIQLTHNELSAWLDVRPYMDTAPYTIHESSSVQRCYRFFRTMGLRHLVVLNSNHCVTGIITRQDLTEERLEHFWFKEGNNMQKYINIDSVDSVEFRENLRPADFEETKLFRYNHGHDSSSYDDGGFGGGGMSTKYGDTGGNTVAYVTTSKASLGASSSRTGHFGRPPQHAAAAGAGSSSSLMSVEQFDTPGLGSLSQHGRQSDHRPTSSSYTAPVPPAVETQSSSNQLDSDTTSLFIGPSSTSSSVSGTGGSSVLKSSFTGALSNTKRPVSTRGQKEPKTMKKSNL